jgi:hypothetical protein
VTRLLVADRAATPGGLAPETLASAERRIRTAVAYSPTGHTDGADVLVRGGAQSDAFIDAMLTTTGATASDGRPAQSFRRIELAAALGMLVPPPG